MVNYSRAFQLLEKAHGLAPYYLGRGYAFPPLHVLIEVTYRCNLSCEMCQFFQFIGDDAPRFSRGDELSGDEIIKLLDELPWYTLVTFTGGELFVRKDMMDILERACRKHRVSIITNGTMLDAGRIERLAGMAPRGMFGKGLILVNVSMEGGEKTHDMIANVKGSFQKTLGALRGLSEARGRRGGKLPVLNMKTVITSKNQAELEYLYGLAAELGLDIFNPMIMSYIDAHPQRLTGGIDRRIDTAPLMGEGLDTALLKAQLDSIGSASKKPNMPQIRLTPPEMPMAEVVRYYSGTLDIRDYRCYSPWSVAAVSAYGDVFVCPYWRHGNIRESSFNKLWNGPELRRLRRRVRKDGIYAGCMGCCSMTFRG